MFKKRVLILLPVFDIGGAEKQGFYAAKELKETGNYETEIWAFGRSKGTLIPLIEEQGISYTDLNVDFGILENTKNRILFYLKFIKKLRKNKFYAVIPFTFHSNLTVATCFRFSGVKKALWFQIAMEHHIGLGRFEKIGAKFRPTYASNSIAAGNYVRVRHGLPNDHKVHFIPNPFEKKPFKKSREEWREELNLKQDEFSFAIVANFFYEKDHLTLLRAIKILKEKGVTCKIFFAGDNVNDGLIALKIKAFILDNAIYDYVKFTGVISDVPGFLQGMDCTMLTSSTEGSPNALIEYVAYKRPVIVSDIKPNMEIVGSDYPYNFPVGNEFKLAELMEILMEAPSGLKERAEILGNKIVKKYSKEENLKAFVSILES